MFEEFVDLADLASWAQTGAVWHWLSRVLLEAERVGAEEARALEYLAVEHWELTSSDDHDRLRNWLWVDDFLRPSIKGLLERMVFSMCGALLSDLVDVFLKWGGTWYDPRRDETWRLVVCPNRDLYIIFCRTGQNFRHGQKVFTLDPMTAYRLADYVRLFANGR